MKVELLRLLPDGSMAWQPATVVPNNNRLDVVNEAGNKLIAGATKEFIHKQIAMCNITAPKTLAELWHALDC